MTSEADHVLPKLYHFKLNAKRPWAEAIDIAGDVIRAGGLVAFPTETVYGLGANALDAGAVDKIFRAKQRPASNPLIAHLAKMEDLPSVASDIPPLAYKLGERFWPGPLTLVLPRSPAIPPNLSAGLDSVAARVPDHPVALALLEAAKTPIAAPSANLFARPSPTTAQHVLDDLHDALDVLLDAGETSIGVESTIVSLLDDGPQLLRPGGVDLESLRQAIPDLQYSPQYLNERETAPAPGGMLRHYSPRATLVLFSGDDDKAVYAAMRARIARHERVGLLATDADARAFARLGVKIERLGKNDKRAAKRLFAAMRALDRQRVDLIIARAPAKRGLGLALWDRLLRAAAGSLVEVSSAPTE